MIELPKDKERRERMMDRIAEIRKEQAEHDAMRARIQENCPHRYRGTSDWAIDLTHNFPDRIPRGICHLCNLVIHPKHWANAGPNETRIKAAHSLYPVVEALEKKAYADSFLDSVYGAAVAHSFWFSLDRTSILAWIEYDYKRAQAAIRQDLDDQTAQYVRRIVK